MPVLNEVDYLEKQSEQTGMMLKILGNMVAFFFGVGAMIGVALMPWMRQHLSSAAILALSLLFAYLFLVGLYESWTIPLAVLLVIPLGLVGAIFAGVAFILAIVALITKSGRGPAVAALLLSIAELVMHGIVIAALIGKCEILIQGYLKHDNLADLSTVQLWLSRALNAQSALQIAHSAAERLPRSEFRGNL